MQLFILPPYIILKNQNTTDLTTALFKTKSVQLLTCYLLTLLGPFTWRKVVSGKGVTPPSRVNFSERLFEKKVDPFARVKSWLYNDNSARAHSDLLALTKFTRLGDSKCLYRKRVTQLGGSPFWLSQLFVYHVSGSSSFVTQCRESLLA